MAERMPAPASVWLTSVPAAPTSPVNVAMTSPDETDIAFAHSFAAGETIRAVFATSQGRYTVWALDRTCGLPLVLGPNDEAQVTLTVNPDATCVLAVTWQGRSDAPGWPRHGDGVLITNHNVGDRTPRLEDEPSATDGG